MTADSPQSIRIPILRLPHGGGLPLPDYATEGAAGLDIRAAVDAASPVTLKPLERALIPAGFSMAVPQGFEAQLRPRSGLALKHGVTVLNSPGTIDSDYRGEIKVLLINLGTENFHVRRGERIAQIVIAPVARAAFAETEALGETARGAGGYGSTGR